MAIENSWERFTDISIMDFLYLKKNSVMGGVQKNSFGRRNLLDEHLTMLEKEFSNSSMLEFYHVWLIVNIRREINLKHNIEKFFILWAEESDFLLKRLDSRWLVSASDTIIDCSCDDTEIATSMSVVLFANTIKLYETERLILSSKKSDTLEAGLIELFDGISAFRIGHGDMIFNMMERLASKEVATVSQKILMEILHRVHRFDTVYQRMANQHINLTTAWWKNEQLFIKKS